MRSIHCKVEVTSSFQKAKSQRLIYNRYDALAWARQVGWDHISAGLCDYSKCMAVKSYINKGALELGPNKRPRLSPLYTYPTFASPLITKKP